MKVSRLDLDRRGILKVAAGAGGALVLNISWPTSLNAEPTEPDRGLLAGGALAVLPDGTVTLSLPKTEMGQGVYTSIAMLIAEELEVDPRSLTIDLPVGNKARFGKISQSTGGSTSIRELWHPMRQVAADARMALVMAAARAWKVDPLKCYVRLGVINHPEGTLFLSYGEVCADAAQWPLPVGTPLKAATNFSVIGKDVNRLDGQDKVYGKAEYGIDVILPGMLIATLAQCPVFGGFLDNCDEKPALAIPGVKQVIKLHDAVAVVADNYWAARQGILAMEPTWTSGEASQDQEGINAALVDATSRAGTEAFNKGEVDLAFAGAALRIDAVYEQPFQAHAAMEPGNCVVRATADTCEIWCGTQIPGAARDEVAALLGLPVEAVTVHNRLLGGGFGRRLEADMIKRAVEVAGQVAGPIKLIWSREEDIQHDLYRPCYCDRMSAALSEEGTPLAWKHHIAGSSIMARLYPKYYKGVDADAVEGAKTILYDVPARRLEWTRQESAVPTGWWRGVGGLRSAFAVECFVDELAAAAGADPVAYRRALLSDSRAKSVLDLAAIHGDWGVSLPKWHGRGIALINIWDTYMAQVVEVEARPGEEPRVHRVVVAVDCGQPVNPKGIRAQVEGGVIFGISATLFGEITLANGQVEQSNFHDYRILRMNEAPLIETYIVDSDEAPGGMGEPPAAAVGPALANAVFAATGLRVRSLPLAAKLQS